MKKRLALLISGKGSNMERIIKNCGSGFINASVIFVASDRPEAPGLEKARSFEIPVQILPYREKGRHGAESSLLEKILRERIDLVVLAGFMRILSPWFVNQLAGKIINIHPSLLPAFPGAGSIERAWEAGVRVTGVTVHFVDEQVDHGPIIAQEPVRIGYDDTLESLERKIHDVEHRIYSRVLRDFSGKANLATFKRRQLV
ncbi:MAG: phosphoribosylglycinamide formyltransferase [Thermovirgaceae bacterium]